MKVVMVSEKDVLAAVEREAGEAREVMAQFKQQIADIRAQLAEVGGEVEAGARPTSGGVSYLELKLQLLLSYCTHLSVRGSTPLPPLLACRRTPAVR